MVVYVLLLAVLSDVKYILSSFKRSYWNSKIKRNIFRRPLYIIESINFICWTQIGSRQIMCILVRLRAKRFEFNTKSWPVTIMLRMCLWIELCSSESLLTFVVKVSDIFNYFHLLRNILSKLRESSRRHIFNKKSIPNDLGYSCLHANTLLVENMIL